MLPSNSTCPKSDGFDKNPLTIAQEDLIQKNFPTQSQQSNCWHHWEIVITQYYPHTSLNWVVRKVIKRILKKDILSFLSE